MTDKHILYGMAGSLYTGKVRAYMRQQGIAFVERGAGHPHFRDEVLPVIGRFIMPVVQTPQGEIIQDGTAILDHFEASDLKKHTIFPQCSVLRSIAYLFELFGGEGVIPRKSSGVLRWKSVARSGGFPALRGDNMGTVTGWIKED